MAENVGNPNILTADQIRSLGEQFLITERQENTMKMIAEESTTAAANPSLTWVQLVDQIKEVKKRKNDRLGSYVNYIPGLELSDRDVGRGAFNNARWQLSLSTTVAPQPRQRNQQLNNTGVPRNNTNTTQVNNNGQGALDADQIRSLGRQYLINERQEQNNPSLTWDELVKQIKKDMPKGRRLWGSSYVNYIPGLESLDPQIGRNAFNNAPARWHLSLSPTVPPVAAPLPPVALPPIAALEPSGNNDNAHLSNRQQVTGQQTLGQGTQSQAPINDDLVDTSQGAVSSKCSPSSFAKLISVEFSKLGVISVSLEKSSSTDRHGLIYITQGGKVVLKGIDSDGPFSKVKNITSDMVIDSINRKKVTSNDTFNEKYIQVEEGTVQIDIVESEIAKALSPPNRGKTKRDITAEKGSPNSQPRQRNRVESNNKSNGDEDESSQDGISAGAPNDKSTDKDESDSVDQSSLVKNKSADYDRKVDALEFEKMSKSCTVVSPFPEEFTSKLLNQASKRKKTIDLPSLGKWNKVQVLDKLGEGVYGSVWKCKLYPADSSDPIICAVKVQIPSKDTSLSSLSFEFTTQVSLAFHAEDDEECPFPRSIALYTYTDTDGTNNGGLLFMTLESGVTVHDIAMNAFPGEKPVPMEIVAYVADHLLTRIETLHNLGVLHCDIKTDNCILTESGALKVIDFGRAQNLPSLTYTFQGSSVGTDRSMMSKNKRQDKPWGIDQDLYGLWVTIFFLIYKEHPKESNTCTDKKTGEMSFRPNVKHFSIPRSQRGMWTKFFDLLLNINPSEYTKTVSSARALLRSYMEEEENKKKIEEELENLLSRLSSLN